MRKRSENSYKSYEKMFVGRAAVCYFLILLMLLSCVLRTAVISVKGYDTVSAEQSEYKIKYKKLRGTIYDRNMVPLTNNKKTVVAVVAPTERTAVAVSALLEGEEKENLLNKLRDNKPAICVLPEKIECEGIACTQFYETEGSSDCCHIVGYLDSEGHGAAGLEAAYDSLLYSDEYLCASVCVDGKGRMLLGTKPEFKGQSSVLSNAVVSTIDINMQNAVREATGGINKGAVVLAEVKTGKIRAMVSLPEYDTANISEYLKRDDAPFLNRAILSYSVGSIFKPCVATAGIESGVADCLYDCTGSTFIVDRYFKCHKSGGHGTVDLRGAIAQSCNCFFYNYAFLLGGEKIYKTARIFGFGAPIKIADNIKTKEGILPDAETLKNPARLANFSIGQGDFSASPVSMLPLYMAIANGGKYYLPSLVEKTVCEGKQTEYDIGNPTVAMSENTANTIKDHLKSVVEEGTATGAQPKTVSAAGKTATAQTGQKDQNGNKVNNSWFCGFFPADNPEYVAVILSESGTTSSTCKAFADIADKIISLGSQNIE